LDDLTRLIANGRFDVPTFVLQESPMILDRFLLSSQPAVRCSCEQFFAMLFPRFCPVTGMCEVTLFPKHPNEREQDLHNGVLSDVLPKWDGFVQNLTRVDQYLQSIRIWHFLAKGTDGLSNERVEIAIASLRQLIRKQKYRDLNVLALLHFIFEASAEMVGPLFYDLFEMCFNPTPSSHADQVLDVFLEFMRLR
jgi:hypothetical protein